MKEKQEDGRLRESLRVTWIGFFVNLAMSLLKLLAGIFGRSAAMVSDAIHSMSDLASDIVVLIGVRLGARPVDGSHDYGHGKFETLTAVIVGLMVLAAGAGIAFSGAAAILRAIHGSIPVAPGWIALAAALFSIIGKEVLYQYTVRAGKRLVSQTLIANAWHHRSDAFSSVGTLAGIGGAFVLGGRWTILDPVAALIVSFFILRVGCKILKTGIQELLDASLPDVVEEEMDMIIRSVRGVRDLHKLRTRAIGASYAIDVHVLVNGAQSVTAGHAIASRVEQALRKRFGAGTFVSIHIEPET